MGFFVKAIALFILCIGESLVALGDMGTASSFDPTYPITVCNGSSGQNPYPNNRYAGVNEGLWDGDAACGRRYRLSCVSGPCKDVEATIEVEVRYFCPRSHCPSTLVLAEDDFADVSISPNATIRIDFIQV